MRVCLADKISYHISVKFQELSVIGRELLDSDLHCDMLEELFGEVRGRVISIVSCIQKAQP